MCSSSSRVTLWSAVCCIASDTWSAWLAPGAGQLHANMLSRLRMVRNLMGLGWLRLTQPSLSSLMNNVDVAFILCPVCSWQVTFMTLV